MVPGDQVDREWRCVVGWLAGAGHGEGEVVLLNGMAEALKPARSSQGKPPAQADCAKSSQRNGVIIWAGALAFPSKFHHGKRHKTRGAFYAMG